MVRRVIVWVSACSAMGCAALIGANFDDEGPAPPTAGRDASVASLDPAQDAGRRDLSRGSSDAMVAGDAAPRGEDASTSGTCARAAGMGDLRVTEVMFQAPYYAQWVEIRNVSRCRVNLRDISVVSSRTIPAGSDEHANLVTADVWVDPGERAVISSSAGFPVVQGPSFGPPYDTLSPAWLMTPLSVQIRRGTMVIQMLSPMPDNLVVTVRQSFALPEDCPAARADDVSTWPTSTTAFTPNTVDVGQMGTPGKPNIDVL